MKNFAHAGWITRVLALLLGGGLAMLSAINYHSPDFVWSATTAFPAWGRALCDPNFWFGLLSMIGYVSALWCTGAVFDALRTRLPFAGQSLKALTLTGFFLLLGSVSAMLKFDIRFNDIRHVSGFSAGFTIDDHTIPVAVIGVVFLLIARQARRLRSELDAIV